MRVLMVAPFERGRGQGGSQRSTAIAERLEQRGTDVGWQVVRRRETSPAAKLRALARGEPALAGLYERPSRLAPGAWDAVLIAHSYLVPVLAGALGETPAVVDFHNLEWRGLLDSARLERAARRLPGPRDAYLAAQVVLLRRLERRILARGPLGLLVSPNELAWARSVAAPERLLFAPSVIPGAEELAAAEVRARRDPRPGQLAYVGTLTFPTNLRSLERFLARDWPAMRAADPGLTLTVAGRAAEPDRARLERHPGVRALGFVEDLVPVLARCAAVVMPFDGAAGTSLRPLFYALAQLPVIGPGDAFRGLPFDIGIAADSPAGWASAVGALRAATPGGISGACEAAVAHQRDPEPWDRLAAALEALRAMRAAAPTGRALLTARGSEVAL